MCESVLANAGRLKTDPNNVPISCPQSTDNPKSFNLAPNLGAVWGPVSVRGPLVPTCGPSVSHSPTFPPLPPNPTSTTFPSSRRHKKGHPSRCRRSPYFPTMFERPHRLKTCCLCPRASTLPSSPHPEAAPLTRATAAAQSRVLVPPRGYDASDASRSTVRRHARIVIGLLPE
jgi:hypothetical protein